MQVPVRVPQEGGSVTVIGSISPKDNAEIIKAIKLGFKISKEAQKLLRTEPFLVGAIRDEICILLDDRRK